MSNITYEALSANNYGGYLLKEAPERVLQFGEGNFLRAFVDYFFDLINERCGWNGKLVAVQPIGNPALKEKFTEQDCLYTLYLRGIEGGKQVNHKRIISSLSRCISAETEFDTVLKCAHNPSLRFVVSNTTEAGIVFRPDDKFDAANTAAFPGKLTRFLYERFTFFGGANEKGLVMLPCELTENNGKALKACVEQYIKLWLLDEAFAAWVENANVFCSTLVDRIVTGYPQNAEELNAENGYTDHLLVAGEPFGFWVIEGPESLKAELPFEKAGLPVLITNDHSPYKIRKVRILNGAHTTSACAALLSGIETVGEMMEDKSFKSYLNTAVYNEILPTINLPKAELEAFAASVFERFINPYIRHELISLTLNITSKWRARVLPSVLDYSQLFGKIPPLLTFGFAAYAAYMQGSSKVQDDKEVLDFFAANRDNDNLIPDLCAEKAFWGMDLNEIPGFTAAASHYFAGIKADGARQTLDALLKEVDKNA